MRDDYAAVTPRRVALTCVQRVVKFCHTSPHARHGRRTIRIRFTIAVHVRWTFYHVMTRSHTLSPPKSFEHAQNFFSWPACEQRVSWHVVARPKYVRGALVTRRTRFAGVLHSLLTRWACRWSPNAGECNHSHYKVWSEINYPFSNRPNVTFSQRFHSALERIQTLVMTIMIFKYWIWNDFHTGIRFSYIFIWNNSSINANSKRGPYWR